MPAATTILAGLALGLGAKTMVDSKKASEQAEAKAQANTEAQLRAEEDARRKEAEEKFRAGGLQSRQIARQLGAQPTAMATPDLSGVASGGKQLIGQ